MLRLRTVRGLNLKEYTKKTGENFWKKTPQIDKFTSQKQSGKDEKWVP